MTCHASISLSITCLVFFICFNACRSEGSSKKDSILKIETDTLLLATSKEEKPLQPYSDFLQDLQTKRKQYVKAGNGDSSKHLFFQFIHQDLPVYWIGTKWDFNGITRVPKEGAIACGYFVTNTLTNAGFDIPRFKLAQAPSAEMIEALCTNIQKPANFEALKAYLIGEENETVFIVGLDFHTGYITKASKDEIYFIHSNYIGREGVVKERIDESVALNRSKFYMIGRLSDNKFITQF